MSRHLKLRDNMDWGLIATVFFILVMGLLCLFSSTRVSGSDIFIKQLIWICCGWLLMFIVFAIDYRVLMRLAWLVYLVMVIMLVLLLLTGREISGARRWISMGPVGMQPSEVAKLTVIIWTAYWGAHHKDIEPYGLRGLVRPLVVLLVPVLLVFLEPDLGTAGIIMIIAVSMLLVLGIKRSTLIGASLTVAAVIPFGWMSLKEYQRLRILSFLDPSRDPLGSGYHAIQSKIAVGSGGLMGKGAFQGTQTQLRFLPEHHTDFIFSVVAEEWGFLGSSVLIFLYLLLITRIISIGLNAKDRFGAMLCFGIAIYFILHVFINIAMAIGIFPVVGVPLPFVSYGGSFMMMNMACIGVVLSVSRRRFIF
ncbi:MAG: rod shape-determining protein RodA [Thermodesulfobacteriota bacterium]|nr:rod shape-determining protein RodA [Thermodesulfobacteriota bacterium]